MGNTSNPASNEEREGTPDGHSKVDSDSAKPELELPIEFQLREELLLHEREGNSAVPYAILEDPSSGKYFRLGSSEQQFVRELLKI